MLPEQRASLIRLASALPVGSPERKAILAGVSRTAAEHKPGDVWKTDSGRWRAMDPKGNAWSFEDKDDASLYAKGKRPSKGKDKSKGSGDLTKDLGEVSKALKENKAEVEKALDTPKVKKALDDWEALADSESAERKAKAMSALGRTVGGAIPGALIGSHIAALTIPGVALGGMAGAVLAGPTILATAAVLGLGLALFGNEGTMSDGPAPSESIRKKNMKEQERKKTAAKSLKDQLMDALLNPSKKAIEMLPKAIDKDGNIDAAKVQKAMERSEGKKASDRTFLIRLASTHPVGSPERRAILVGLQKQAAPDWKALLSNTSGNAFEKALLDQLPSLSAQVEMGVEAFAKAMAKSWDGSRSGEEDLEDLKVWIDELDMAAKAIEQWQRLLERSVK